MARSSRDRTSSTGPADDSDALRENIDNLKDALDRVGEQLSVLTDVLDELRDHFAWVMNNADRFHCTSPYVPLTSVPHNPLAPDFGERINRLSAKDLPEESPAASATPKKSSEQGKLW